MIIHQFRWEGFFLNGTVFKASYIHLRFILGLLNSKLINWYYNNEFASTKTVFTEIGARQISQLPFNISNKELSDLISDKVQHILNLKEINAGNEVSHLEKEIDQLVYQLYNLTEEEIKIVEGAV
ncbi:MAG: TaqI-like C-terminal specificity domain-containing protein [Bacteroidota bacterium]